MPNILLIDIDSKIPNIALLKIQLHHQHQGDSVRWGSERDLVLETDIDKAYVSCVFTKNKAKAMEWEGLAEIGGSGYDLSARLPSYIEDLSLRINLGYTTRGCIRSCGFCIVPQKEGKIRIVNGLLDLWDGYSGKITLMDNNILALPDHFLDVCKAARDNGILVDFNQGLDHRLLTTELCNELATIRHREYRFAFDNPDQIDSVLDTINMLNDMGIKRSFWFVLVGYDTTFQEDMERLLFLKDHGQTVFVQRYENNRGNLLVSRWSNQHAVFKTRTFGEFMASERNDKYYRKYQTEIDEYLEGGN